MYDLFQFAIQKITLIDSLKDSFYELIESNTSDATITVIFFTLQRIDITVNNMATFQRINCTIKRELCAFVWNYELFWTMWLADN